MQFGFDKDIIGKFCKKEQDKYSNMLAFRRVVGYDFINNVYIVKDIDNFFHTYGALCPSGMAMPEVYTLDEVFALIDAEIEKEKKKYLILDEKMPNNTKEFRQNEVTEFNRLFRVYRECVNQVKIYNQYLEWAEKKYDFETRELYTKEMAGAQKALRRLDKRFHYYFKKDAKRVQEIVLGYGYFDDIVHAKSRIADLIKRYEKYKSILVNEVGK